MQPPVDAPKAIVGSTLGHFVVLDRIGAGGMGVVFRAHDERLDRDVAIKLLPLGTIHDDAARKQLRKEARIVSKLNHPNIATIYDFDTQDGLDFLVMELIPGSTLDERLASGVLSEKETLRLAAQLVEGLSAAHACGVVHQDLKPSNLRITPDHRLKILDFGLARLFLPPSPTGDTESLQKSQAAKGTLPYMAPEQLLGESVDQRTDIHGAGAVLYEMVTGRRPFKEAQSSRLIDSILHHEPVPPRSINPQISAELERIILKCLEKSPDDRYQAARELEVDLRRLGASSSGHKLALDSGSRNTDPSWFRRNRKYLAIAAPLILAAIAAAAFFLFRSAPVTQEATVVPLTTLPGQEISPSFSPDGTQVAFGWDGENNGAGFDVYVKAVGADKPLRITNHPAAWLEWHGRRMGGTSRFPAQQENIPESSWCHPREVPNGNFCQTMFLRATALEFRGHRIANNLLLWSICKIPQST